MKLLLGSFLLISTVSLISAELCYHCLYVEDQSDNETLISMTRTALHDIGVPTNQVEAQLQQAMNSYKQMGFNLDLSFRRSCEDPRSMPQDSKWPIGDLRTCESKGACGKIFSAANALTTVWRGCPLSCQVGSQNNIDIACCHGDLCNQGTVAMVAKLLLLGSILMNVVLNLV